jgi:site-specific recombinase XerD
MKTYINWLKSRNLSQNTILNYPANVRQYGDKTFDTKNLLNYTKKALKLYEPTSLKNKLAALKSYAKFKKLKANWEKVARLIPKVQKKFHETITEPELARLKQARTERSQAIHERNNLMLDFLFYSGLRVSELINLKHSDWQDNQLRILGKGNKVRYIFLPEFLAKIIKPYSADYLFTNEHNKPFLRE